MRPFLALLLLTGAIARADRLVTMPTARKLPYGATRIELLSELGEAREQLGFLGYGIGKSFEAEADYWRTAGASGAALDLSFVERSPLPGIVPGLALGVLGLVGDSPGGARPYVCATFAEIFSTESGDAVADVTLGVIWNGRPLGFLALSAPLTPNLRLLAEFDGERPLAGVQLAVRRDLAVRAIFRDHSTMLGLNWTNRR